MASDNQISDDFWRFMQNRLGYNDEQLEKFKTVVGQASWYCKVGQDRNIYH